MKSIKSMNDIQFLKESRSLATTLCEYLLNYFLQLRESLINGEPEEDFNLEPYGYIVILEETDDVRDLHEAGLNPHNNGLLGSWPEFVNLIELDGISLYQVGILFDNEYMQIFYVPVGMFDEETEAFLREYSEDCMSYSKGGQNGPR